MACCGRTSRVAPASGGLVSEKEICLNAQGTIVGAASLRAQVAESEGLTAGARARLWQHLLGIAAWEASEAEIKAHTAELTIRFEELLHRAEVEGAVERQDVTVIDSDVPRTDRELPRWHDEAALAPLRAMLLAHCVHRAGGSTARGYYQGMNDLAAVMLDQALPLSPLRTCIGCVGSQPCVLKHRLEPLRPLRRWSRRRRRRHHRSRRRRSRSRSSSSSSLG